MIWLIVMPFCDKILGAREPSSNVHSPYALAGITLWLNVTQATSVAIATGLYGLVFFLHREKKLCSLLYIVFVA